MGYTNVKVYAVEASAVKNKLDKMEPVVIFDSRPTRPKYVQGHLPGALSIPDKQYDQLKGILPVDKNIPLIFYCGGFT